MLIVKNCKSEMVLELTQTTDSQAEVLKQQADSLETHQIVFLIERTSHYINELKTTTNQHTWLEVAMIDLANLAENTKLADLQNRLLKLESGETQHVSVPNYKTPPLPVQKPSMKPAGVVSPQNMPPIAKMPETVSQMLKQETPEAEVQPEPQEDFSPVPMSSTEVKVNDVAELWRSLIENIASVPTKQLLLQLAKPVEISAQSVVITMKSEAFIKQLNESSKKQALIDAVDKLFNQKNSNVVIRLPQASDAEIKQVVVDSPKKEEPEVKEEKVVEVTTEAFKETGHPEMVEVVEVVETKKVSDMSALSDQAKMVKDLFDGKVVE